MSSRGSGTFPLKIRPYNGRAWASSHILPTPRGPCTLAAHYTSEKGEQQQQQQSEAAPSAESILEEVAAVFVFLGKVYLINGTDYTFSLSLLVRRPCILTAS